MLFKVFLTVCKEQLEKVKELVMDVVWNNYVIDKFREKTKPSDLRSRDLIEDLSKIKEPKAIPYEQLPLISPRVFNHYSKKTQRTLIRDVEELFKMRLINFDHGLIRAHKEEILAFLPTSLPLPMPQSQDRNDGDKSRRRRRAAKLTA